MTSPAVVAEAGTTVRKVARLMLDEGVGAIPVIDASGAAIGMASDGGSSDDGRTTAAARGGSPSSQSAPPRTTSLAITGTAPSTRSCRRR